MNKLAIAFGLLLGACMGTATYSSGGYASGGATVYTPDLVDVEPGVQVIADYDEPVFYSESFYWRNNGGRWYRSSTYNGGWIEASPPMAVGRISSPDRYRHWHPAGYQPRNRGPAGGPNNRGPGPEVRDHRDNYPGPGVGPGPAGGPNNRDYHDPNRGGGPGPGPGGADHRDDRRDNDNRGNDNRGGNRNDDNRGNRNDNRGNDNRGNDNRGNNDNTPRPPVERDHR